MKRIIDFLTNDFGVDRNTAATLIITIFTFLIGLIATLLTNYIITKIKKRGYRKGFKVVIKDFIDSCKRQYKTFINPTAEQKVLEGEDFVIRIVPNSSLSYLSSIDKKDFIINFSSIFNKKRPKVISKLFYIIESVKVVNDETPKGIIILFDKYSVQEHIFQEHLDELRKINDQFINEILSPNFHSHPEKIFIENYLNIFKSWIENGQNTQLKKFGE